MPILGQVGAWSGRSAPVSLGAVSGDSCRGTLQSSVPAAGAGARTRSRPICPLDDDGRATS